MFSNRLKKAISVFMTGAVLLSCSGCLNSGGGKKAVIEAADKLASNMISANAGKLIKGSTLDKDSTEADDLKSILDDGNASKNQKAFSNAVEDSMEYEIDERSCKINRNKASVDIIFTFPDYDEVLQDTYKNIDALTKALKKADTFEQPFTAEFEKVDGEWIPSNVATKEFLEFYAYKNAELKLELTAEMIRSFINRTLSGFWLAQENFYIDTNFIQYDFFFDSVVYDYVDLGLMLHFNLYKDGEIIYTSPDIHFGESTNIPCRVDADDLGLGFFDLFDTGLYSIELVMPDGESIDTFSVNVLMSDPFTNPGGGGSGSGSTMDGEWIYYVFVDEAFRQSVLEAGWIDYDDNGSLTGDYIYSDDVETMAFKIKVEGNFDKTLYYQYGYAKDENSIEDALQNPLYTDVSNRKSEAGENYYIFDYEPLEVKEGYYIFVVADDEDNMLMYGFCEVS